MQRDALGSATEPLPGLAAPLSGVLFGRGLRLLRDPNRQRYAVFLEGTALFEWQADDGASRRLVMAQIVNAKLGSQIEVAQVFGVHRNTVARIARQVGIDGAEATIRRKPGPRGAHKVTPAVRAELWRAAEAGLSSYAAQREVERRVGVALSQSHVDRLLRQLKRTRGRQAALGLASDEPLAPLAVGSAEALVAAGDESAGPEQRPAMAECPALGLAPGQTVVSRYLGLTLFYPALQAVGLLTIAEQVYQCARAVRFGVRQVFWHLFCLALLQEPTLERAKRLLRADLGAVVGSGRAACVKTLRRKLAALSEQRQAVKLGLLLARRWLEVGLLNGSYLYIDGDVKVYSGKRRLAEVGGSQRRMPLPGMVQYFGNDLRGRPLLVVSEEVSGNLAQSLPKVIAAVRPVVGDRRFTVIFDRGGYDGDLFTWLVGQGLDFITYQRGSGTLPADQFRRREVCWQGRRVRFWLAEDRVPVRGSGPWRRIVLRTVDGHQTPILTSLGSPVASTRIAALMLARWRQENFFQYARSHLGLDALMSSRAELATDQEVPHPAIRLEPRLVADTVKLAAYNAQGWLADRLARHSANAYDLHDLLRSFVHLSGTMTRQPDGALRIRLDPPDIPLCRRALEGLCDDLNGLTPCFLGTNIPVIYEVAMYHSTKAV